MIVSLAARPPTVVVLESDLDAALAHLRGLPFGVTGSLPAAWGRQRLLQRIREALGPRPRCAAAPGRAGRVGAGIAVRRRCGRR